MLLFQIESNKFQTEIAKDKTNRRKKETKQSPSNFKFGIPRWLPIRGLVLHGWLVDGWRGGGVVDVDYGGCGGVWLATVAAAARDAAAAAGPAGEVAPHC